MNDKTLTRRVIPICRPRASGDKWPFEGRTSGSSRDMPEQAFRYRTILEVAVISLLIYFIVGSPGFSRVATNEQDDRLSDFPLAKVKAGQLVHPSPDLQCPQHQYHTHIFSAHPLLVYIDGFLSNGEVEHLLRVSEHKWNISTVSNRGVESVDDSVRKSERAAIDRDETVQCIEQRALSFQGWPQDHFIERLWLQRYNVSGHYSLHYDWATASKSSRRVSSFMVYVKDDCVDGGTNFPRLDAPKDPKWCNFIECDPNAQDAKGVIFKPRVGSAIFWMNFDTEGRGYKDTIHAGMPVTAGQKIGLNIWTWYQAGHKLQ